MKTAIVFDCEFLCVEGSPQRFWCGACDPDPAVVQIGAVKIGLEGDFPLLDTCRAFIQPIDRLGKRCALDPFFTRLTGITEANIQADGLSLQNALAEVDCFSEGARFWSWGKDELNMVAISCYVAGVPAAIPAHRFDNVVKLVIAAGMAPEDIGKTRSSTLADYYGVEHPPLQKHDALGDALSVAYALQHLLRTGRLKPDAFKQADVPTR
jgi:DNA polymerase III epsilon subunit-like protein